MVRTTDVPRVKISLSPALGCFIAMLFRRRVLMSLERARTRLRATPRAIPGGRSSPAGERDANAILAPYSTPGRPE